MTYKLAMAAGQDAGNRSMRKAGRTEWSEDDYNVAVAEQSRLLGEDPSAIIAATHADKEPDVS